MLKLGLAWTVFILVLKLIFRDLLIQHSCAYSLCAMLLQGAICFHKSRKFNKRCNGYLFTRTIAAKSGYHQVVYNRFISIWKRYRQVSFQAFHFTTAQTSEVNVIVGMNLLLLPAILAHRKVLLAIVAHHPVYFSVFAVPVQHAINGSPVNIGAYRILNHIVTHRSSRGF